MYRALVGIMLLAALVFGVFWAISISESIESTPITSSRPFTSTTSSAPSVPSWRTSSTRYYGGDYLKLQGVVVYDGTQFIITNKDEFHWVNVKLEINGGLFSSGYTYSVSRIPVGTWHIDVSNFSKRSGEIFNPFAVKPRSLRISTYNDEGEMTGFGERNWD